MRPTDPRTPGIAPTRPTPGTAARPLCALLLDIEPATKELIALWLAGEGWQLRTEPRPDDAPALILIEIAFPRREDRQRLHGLAEVWPGVPVIVLSPTFFAEVPHRGDVARQLGAAAVLATPLRHERLVAAVRDALGAPG